MSETSYEFTPAQNALIADLARKMTAVGGFLTAAGAAAVIGLAASVLRSRTDAAIVLILVAAFFLAIGVWTVLAGREFRRIVATEGHDIEHTMSALAQLRRFYALHFWLIVVYLVLIVLAILGYPAGLQ